MVLIKTVYEKNFIASEAKRCLASTVKNTHILPDCIDALTEGLLNKNIQLAEFSISYLSDLV